MENIITSKGQRRISNLPSKLLVSAASDNDLSDIENKAFTSNVQASNDSKVIKFTVNIKVTCIYFSLSLVF